MSDFPHLNNAPIVEGLIDIRVRARKGLDPGGLLEIHNRLKSQYPNVKPIHQVTAYLEVKGQEASQQSLSRRESGYRIESADGRNVIQSQVEGFTFSRLKPYETWDALLEGAKVAWAHYSDVARPDAIVRVATRFINRVEIPLPVGQIAEYFAAPPTIPTGLPPFVSEYFSRVVIGEPETEATVILTQALEPAGGGNNVLSCIVDIDVFKDVSLRPDSPDCWNLLTLFRSLKNRAFFASVTPKTLELFS